MAGAALWLGLGLSDHWMSAACWLPAAAWTSRPWRARDAAVAAALLLTGATLYLQLPLCAAREPVWGDPGRAAGLAGVILRSDFLPQAALKPAGMTGWQLGHALLFPVREAGLSFTLLALAGAAALWRARPRALGLLGGGRVLLLAGVAALANPVHVASGEFVFWLSDRFFLPYLAALAAAAGAGLLTLRAALPPHRRWAAWAAGAGLLAAELAGHRTRNDHGRDYLGFDYAENLRVSLGGSTVLFAEADYQMFPMLALLHVERRAPETVFIVTNPFLNRDWGWRRLAARRPEAPDLAPPAPQGADPPHAETRPPLGLLADRLGTGRRPCSLSMCSYPVLRERMTPRGILHELAPTGARPSPVGAAATDGWFRRFRLRGLFSSPPFKDDAALSVLDIYGLTRANPATPAIAAHRYEDALAAIRPALAYPGKIGRGRLLLAVGQALAQLGRFAEAEAAFRAAARLAPRDLVLWTNVATACAAQGRTAEALRLFASVLRRNPRHAAALGNLVLLRRQMGQP